jgi:hypothetical protein
MKKQLSGLRTHHLRSNFGKVEHKAFFSCRVVCQVLAGNGSNNIDP